MKARNVLATSAATLVLVGGAATGTMFGGPRASSAQDGTSTGTTTQSGPDGFARGDRIGKSIDAAAEALGLEPEELSERLCDGETIADVAGAESVELQVVIDAMVAADGRLTEEQAADKKATATERATASVDETWPTEGGWRTRPGW